MIDGRSSVHFIVCVWHHLSNIGSQEKLLEMCKVFTAMTESRQKKTSVKQVSFIVLLFYSSTNSVILPLSVALAQNAF